MEILNNIAEIAVAITGFSALASIFRQKKEEWNNWDNLNLLKFYGMVEQSSLLLVFCFLPQILNNYLDESLSFQICTIVYGLVSTSYLLLVFKRNKKLMGSVLISGYITGVILFSGLLFTTVCYASGFGLLGADYTSNYISIAYWQLLYSLLFFVMLMYSTVRRPRQKQS